MKEVINPYIFPGIIHKRCLEGITPHRVVEAVCENYGISQIRLKEKNRSPLLTHARYTIWSILKEMGVSLKGSGIYTGGHDHTTVINGICRLTNLRNKNDREKTRYESIRNSILRVPFGEMFNTNQREIESTIELNVKIKSNQ